MVIRLDLDVTNSSKNLNDLIALIQNSSWLYLRTVVHFQLQNEVLLNRTAFRFQVRVNVSSHGCYSSEFRGGLVKKIQ